METAATRANLPDKTKIRHLVVFHDKPRLYLESVDIGKKTCSGTEVLDLDEIVLIPMAAGVSVSANLKRIAKTGYVPQDAHVLEAFLESEFAIPASFAGNNVFFCGEPPDVESQAASRNVMFMTETRHGWTAWCAEMSQAVPPNSFAACVEKKEIL